MFWYVMGGLIHIILVGALGLHIKFVEGCARKEPKAPTKGNKSPSPTTILAEMLALEILQMKWYPEYRPSFADIGSYFPWSICIFKLQDGTVLDARLCPKDSPTFDTFSIQYSLHSFNAEETLILKEASRKAIFMLKDRIEQEAEDKRQLAALDAINSRMGLDKAGTEE